METISKFLDFLDRRAVIRRIVLFVTLWMTWKAFTWAAEFAIVYPKGGVDAAAIIAAVTAPIAALQGFIFNSYVGRKEGS